MRLNRPKKREPERARRQRGEAVPKRNPTFSYYAKRAPDETVTQVRRQGDKPTKRPQRASLMSQLSFWLLVVVVLVCLVKVLSLNTNPQVIMLGQTSISGSYTHPSSVYIKAAQVALNSSVTNRLKLTADTGGIANKLKRQFPELADVSVTLPLIGNRPVVYISPAQPSLFLASSTGNVLAISHNGFALAQVTTAVTSGVPLVHDESGVILRPGRQALPGSTVMFIETVSYQLRAAKLIVAGMTLPKDSPYEIDVAISGKPYIARFNLQQDARGQAGTLLATIGSLGANNPNSYIDVRVPGRAYYK